VLSGYMAEIKYTPKIVLVKRMILPEIERLQNLTGKAVNQDKLLAILRLEGLTKNQAILLLEDLDTVGEIFWNRNRHTVRRGELIEAQEKAKEKIEEDNVDALLDAEVKPNEEQDTK